MCRNTRLTLHLTPGQLALAEQLADLVDLPGEERTDEQAQIMVTLGRELAQRLMPVILTAVKTIRQPIPAPPTDSPLHGGDI